MITLPLEAWAALATGAAVVLMRPDGRWIAGHRLGVVQSPRWPLRVAALVGAPLLPLAFGLIDGAAAVVVVLTAVAVAGFVTRQVLRARQRAGAQRAHADVAESIDALTAELQAGVLPHRALAMAAVDLDVMMPAAQVAALGGDVPEALRTASRQPGCAALQGVAGAWHLSQSCGAPLSTVLGRVARAHRFEAAIADEVRTAVEPARATGRLLAVLPLFGLLLGSGLGADPVHVLTATLPGAICLALGATLACLGVRWIDAAVDRAERR